jgi:large subunit ribosomal protein L25
MNSATTSNTAATNSSVMPGLVADARLPGGKGAAARLRRTGQIPAVAYGKGLPATSIAVSPKEILGILKSERGKNSVIKITLAAYGEKSADKSAATKSLLVMIRDYTYHPVNRNLEHVDFVEVKLDEAVNVDIPLIFTGKPIGVTTGGIIRQVYRTVPVSCLPDRIPLRLEIDITHLALGEHVSTQDLNLGEGVAVRLPAEQTLIAIVAPDKVPVEDEVVAAVPGAAAAPGAPGAPAAAGGAAAPAAAAGGKDAKAPAKDAKKK